MKRFGWFKFGECLVIHQIHQTFPLHGTLLFVTHSFRLQPLPSSEALLCYFVACLGQQGLTHSTYLSGVRELHISNGFPELRFDNTYVQILKGVQVEQSKQRKSPHCCLPITPVILRKLTAVWLAGNSAFNDSAGQ